MTQQELIIHQERTTWLKERKRPLRSSELVRIRSEVGEDGVPIDSCST